LGEDASVDGKSRAGHEGRFVGAEIKHQVRYFLGTAHPPDRLIVGQLLFHFLFAPGIALGQKAIDEGRVNARRTNAIAANAALDEIDLPLAVVSNSLYPSVANSIRRAALDDRVAGKIFSADMVALPKPAPDLYLLASSSMGVPPERCLAIEDSSAGVKAAIAAGVRVIGFVGASHVPPTHAAHLLDMGVVAVARQMSDLPSLVRRLVASVTDGTSTA